MGVCVCVRLKEREWMYVWVRERERERGRQGERESVCVRQRERESVVYGGGDERMYMRDGDRCVSYLQFCIWSCKLCMYIYVFVFKINQCILI